jgi:DNA-binding beta-propeller fold protein YncE
MYYGTVSLVAGPGGADRPAIRSPRLGSNINTIAIDPAERYLYVSERGRNNRESYLLRGPHFGRILVLDPLTLETVQELYGRNQPTGLAVSPDGRFVVATDFLDDNITLYEVTPRRQAE